MLLVCPALIGQQEDPRARKTTRRLLAPADKALEMLAFVGCELDDVLLGHPRLRVEEIDGMRRYSIGPLLAITMVEN
jgi:hypothetical protein